MAAIARAFEEHARYTVAEGKVLRDFAALCERVRLEAAGPGADDDGVTVEDERRWAASRWPHVLASDLPQHGELAVAELIADPRHPAYDGGRGESLRAARDLPVGTVLGTYHGRLVRTTEEEVGASRHALEIDVTDREDAVEAPFSVLGDFGSSMGPLINDFHGTNVDAPNVEFQPAVVVEGADELASKSAKSRPLFYMAIVVTRRARAGEELVTAYGAKYWYESTRDAALASPADDADARWASDMGGRVAGAAPTRAGFLAAAAAAWESGSAGKGNEAMMTTEADFWYARLTEVPH
jgi:hypothetical protein